MCYDIDSLGMKGLSVYIYIYLNKFNGRESVSYTPLDISAIQLLQIRLLYSLLYSNMFVDNGKYRKLFNDRNENEEKYTRTNAHTHTIAHVAAFVVDVVVFFRPPDIRP